MIINHNLNAMNAHRNMGANTVQAGKSMEKLSSGLRINRAGDDAAGLAISEKMRGQIRGLDQASRNAQDGISLLQTAEGALSETHSILQRVRELAVQSTNGSLTDEDRVKIQGETNQLVDEIDNIGNQTQFNTKNILNGAIGQSFSTDNAIGQNGTTDYSGLTAKTITSDTKSGVYGVNITTAATKASTAYNSVGATFGTIDAGASIKLNGVTIDFTAGDTVDLAIGKINIAKDQTGVEAYIGNAGGINFRSVEYGSDAQVKLEDGAVATLTDLNAGITAGSTATGTNVAGQINGQSASGTGKVLTLTSAGDNATGLAVETVSTQKAATTTLTWADATLTAAQTLKVNGTDIALTAGTTATVSTLIAKINAQSSKTGIVASSTSATTLTLTSSTVGDESTIGLQFTSTADVASGLSNGTANTYVGDGAANVTVAIENVATGSDYLDATLNDGIVTVDSNNSLSVHTGANSGQTLEVSINDMRSSAVGKSVANSSSFSSLADIKSKDGVSSATKAEDSIKVIDEAIKVVSEERAKLGAYQNRLEHTIANLGTSSENLSSAESRIRDVDMAKEMMNFSKNNILSQAAQAMLAQANQQPQGVLQLLK